MALLVDGDLARARGHRGALGPAGLAPRTSLLDATTYMRIILPETVIALGLFLLLRREDVELGVATIVIGHVVFNSAYATIVIQARMATLDRHARAGGRRSRRNAVAGLPPRDAAR